MASTGAKLLATELRGRFEAEKEPKRELVEAHPSNNKKGRYRKRESKRC